SDRAEALRKQVDAVQPGGSGQTDFAALSSRLRDLDEVLGAVRATGDPQAQYAAGQIGALRNVAQSQINGGLSPDAFEDRRRELLAVLDAIERTGSPELMGRAAVLRLRVVPQERRDEHEVDRHGRAGRRELPELPCAVEVARRLRGLSLLSSAVARAADWGAVSARLIGRTGVTAGTDFKLMGVATIG